MQLFSRNGFKGTSTRDIAQLAGVNEATLFRHFGRKLDLFWAAADSRLERLKLSRELQTELASDGSPEAVIPMIVAFITENIFRQPELLRLLYVAGFELSGTERLLGEHLGAIYDSITSYFRRCAAKGLIHNVDPAVATLGLAGAVGAHCILQGLFASGQAVDHPDYSRFMLNAFQRPLPDSGDLVSIR